MIVQLCCQSWFVFLSGHKKQSGTPGMAAHVRRGRGFSFVLPPFFPTKILKSRRQKNLMADVIREETRWV